MKGDLLAGWLNPKTQRATAFYALLGVVCSNIYHNGMNHWNFAALALMTGLGTLSGLSDFMRSMRNSPAEPPGGQS